jgi:hypothetical protein
MRTRGEEIYEMGRLDKGGKAKRIEYKQNMRIREGNRIYTTLVLWEGYTFEIRYQSNRQFWQAIRGRVADLFETTSNQQRPSFQAQRRRFKCLSQIS